MAKMRVRESKVKVYDSHEAADAANRAENLARTGVERIRILTAIVGPGHARSKSALSRSYKVVDVPRR
jgi:hypothetical protein